MQLRPSPTPGVRYPHRGATLGTRCFVLFGRWADIVQDAVWAIRLAGLAGLAPVQDQGVREDGPVFFWHDLHEVLLYLYGVLVPGEAEPAGDAADVGIDDDALVHAERLA